MMFSSILAVFVSVSSWGQPVRTHGETGLRYRAYSQKYLNIATPIGSLNTTSNSISESANLKWEAGGRFQVLDRFEVEPNTLAVGMMINGLSATIGYQTLSWGQSFAVGVADLTNPKDLRDPMNTNTAWTNLSVPMLNTEYLFSGGSLQVFWTPFPRANKYARNAHESDFLQSSSVELRQPASLDQSFAASEFGARLNKVFSTGLELSVFALRHWNRNPFYQLQMVGSSLGLQPIAYLQNSYGLDFSYDLNSWIEGTVIRGDVVLHSNFNQVSQDFSTYTRLPSLDFAVGPDWTTDDGLQIAAQVIGHLAGNFHDNLVSLKMGRKVLREKLLLEGLSVVGLNRAQSWVEAKATWFTSSGFEISLLYDYVYGRASESRAVLRQFLNQDRLQTTVRYLF